jgi:hypothetical protein
MHFVFKHKICINKTQICFSVKFSLQISNFVMQRKMYLGSVFGYDFSVIKITGREVSGAHTITYLCGN